MRATTNVFLGAKRVRGKRGRGAGGKTPVFGMLKREGKVYTQVVKNCSVSALIPILEAHSDLGDSVIFSETILKSFGGLMMDLWIMEQKHTIV